MSDTVEQLDTIIKNISRLHKELEELQKAIQDARIQHDEVHEALKSQIELGDLF